MSTPFKMKGFSGFGNSPVKQKLTKEQKQEQKTRAKLEKELNVNPETDTLVKGMTSRSRYVADRTANLNYEAIFPDTTGNRPPGYHSREEVTTQKKKKSDTGKYMAYTTWVKGKKSN